LNAPASSIDFPARPHRGKATTKKDLACPGNYKLQITNYKQITNPKLQIPNKGVSFGQILNAFGEEDTEGTEFNKGFSLCDLCALCG
jgi:hypothetical protein